jgi:hypothetical protein
MRQFAQKTPLKVRFKRLLFLLNPGLNRALQQAIPNEPCCESRFLARLGQKDLCFRE